MTLNSKRLRILFVGSLPPPLGGTTVSLQQLIGYVGAHGVQPVVVDTNANGSGQLKALLRSLWQTLRVIRTVDVATMHFSDRATTKAAPLFWLLFRLFGRPIVYRQFGGAFIRTLAELPRWRRALLRRTALRSDAVLMQTRSMVKSMESMGFKAIWFPTARAASANRYRGTFACQRSTILRCLYVGHVKRAKGVMAAVEAVSAFEQVTLDVYGPLFDISSADLDRPRVRYRGVLEAADVMATMAEYDVLLFPTTWPGEGYSGTLVEAALVGLPMIVSRWQDLPEMFSEDEAMFVDPGAVESLKEGIRTCLECPAELLERSARLRERSAAFESGRVFGRFIQMCADLAVSQDPTMARRHLADNDADSVKSE